MRRASALVPIALIALVGCGSSGGGGASTTAPAATGTPAGGTAAARGTARDWTRFGFDAARTSVGPGRTGIGAGDLRRLRRRKVRLPGTVDSAPIYLANVSVGGRQRRGVFFVTTTYGITLAVEASSGRILWKFEPNGIRAWEGSTQITNSSPVSDPSRRAIYAASPNGLIHKLSVASGHELGGWPVSVTRDASHEKLASPLNISGRYLLAATGGYLGDAPPYQGHVLAIELSSGRIAHVFNSLCSDRQDKLLEPSSCQSSDAAIWGRAAPVVVPDSRRLLIATGNAPFNGRTDWGDSALMLASDASRLLQSYTPATQAELASSDSDLGSTVPAPLPLPGGGKPRYRYAVQGGKDGKLRLLSLSRLNGTPAAGPPTGGELQVLDGAWAFTAPVVWRTHGRVLILSADSGGTVAYEFRGSRPRLHVLWRNGTGGSSPVLAGGLLYVYDVSSGGVNVYRPSSGSKVGTLASGAGHWNSPIVVDGRIALGEGNANGHDNSGVLDIWSR